MSRVNTTGYKGVSTASRNKNRFEAYVMFYSNDSRTRIKRHIGTFDTAKDAFNARVNYIKSLI